MIDQMRRGRDHVPGVVPQGDWLRGTRRADGPALARERKQEVVPARSARSPGKAMGEDAAFEVAAKSVSDCVTVDQ